MTTHNRITFGLSVIGATLLSSAVASNALTVGRCNELVDGNYVPALVVKNGAEKSVYLIGSDGLTRSIVFNEEAALAWSAALLGVSESDINYSDACHKIKEETDPPPPPVIDEEEEEEEDEDDYGGVFDEEIFF